MTLWPSPEQLDSISRLKWWQLAIVATVLIVALLCIALGGGHVAQAVVKLF